MSIVERAIDRLRKSRSLESPPRLTVRHAPGPRPDELGRRPEPVVPPRIRVPSKQVAVDFVALRAAGAIVAEEHGARIRDEFRRIKRPLLAQVDVPPVGEHGPPNVILVVSSMAGEGKTFTAVNLALSIASEPDRTALLIDADIPRPSVTRMFGMQGEPGLVDVLLKEELALGDVMVATDIPGLSVLPAGQAVEHAAELLASRRMQSLVQQLALERSRIVIIDTPPLLARSEAGALVKLAGQTVLVVQADVTEQRAVKNSLQLLEGVPNVSLVLNQCARTFGFDYYYDFYGDTPSEPKALPKP